MTISPGIAIIGACVPLSGERIDVHFMKRFFAVHKTAFLLWGCFLLAVPTKTLASDRWPPERAQSWYDSQPWLVGANFVKRPELPGEPDESCLWTPGSCEALADVSFHKRGGDLKAPWLIASADGQLDVVFTPEGRKAVKRHLGVVAIDYFQIFGRYAGTVAADDGSVIVVKDVHGVCESMDARM